MGLNTQTLEQETVDLVLGINHTVSKGKVAVGWMVDGQLTLAIHTPDGDNFRKKYSIGDRFMVGETEWELEWITPAVGAESYADENVEDGGNILVGRIRKIR